MSEFDREARMKIQIGPKTLTVSIKFVTFLLVTGFSVVASAQYDPEENGVKVLDLSRTAEKSTYLEVSDPGHDT